MQKYRGSKAEKYVIANYYLIAQSFFFYIIFVYISLYDYNQNGIIQANELGFGVAPRPTTT